ncbi:hypothetical protein I4641_02345 [Waterburya agarophytonicola K14]|uniref:Uncharacterized protein n=1 Tax=Waterburya agarophytonicola KI4 TaxID=2874699 RepID=A0A964BNE5_9CYAN|nr:hypothetical protein [Waterburya agarophytonicola]MCC0175821.1 hypothetical protein [Waterburya agarophytonicola KI4]
MTQSLPSKQTETENKNSEDISKKDFADLSTTEMEKLMNKGIKQAKKRMHDKGISSVSSVNGQIYEELPDGTRKKRN